MLGPQTLAAQEAEPPPGLAVLSFACELEGGGERGALMADLLALALTDAFQIVDRENLRQILSEQQLSLAGLVKPEEAVRVGNLTGARLLLTGRIFALGRTQFVSLRLVSVVSGQFKALSLQAGEAATFDDLVTQAAELAAERLPALAAELLQPRSFPPPSVERLPTPPPALSEHQAVGVLAFANFDQGAQEWAWLAKGLPDMIIGDLAAAGLNVVSREQMAEMQAELDMMSKNGLSKPIAPKLARTSRSIQGGFRIEGGSASLTATIIDEQTGKLQHAASQQGPVASLLEMEKSLAAELADVLRGERPGSTNPASFPRWTDSIDAARLNYLGIDAFDRGEFALAWSYFRRALRQDPEYADALYWAGRMMYYQQEYHLARVDLERFLVDYPTHVRAGDAAMEIVNSVQITAASADEVLDILQLAAQTAPKALVHNQYGPGRSTLLSVYAAGLAAQILEPLGRRPEAFARFQEAIQHVPADHLVYLIAWNRMFEMRMARLAETGELWDLPPPHQVQLPIPASLPKKYHPVPWSSEFPSAGMSALYPGAVLGGDEPPGHRFHLASPDNLTLRRDYSAEPVKVTRENPLQSWTTHLHAPPEYSLTMLDIEVVLQPGSPQAMIGFSGLTPGVHQASGDEPLRVRVNLKPGTRTVPLRLFASRPVNLPASAPEIAISGWSVTAQLAKYETAPATVVLHGTQEVPLTVHLDGYSIPRLRGVRTLKNLHAGSHSLRVEPAVSGEGAAAEIDLILAPGETVHLDLAVKVDRRRLLDFAPDKVVASDYELFRMGAAMGDAPQGVAWLQDRDGRWIVVWTARRDLYMSTSSDRGDTWTTAVKLPQPVNSAHEELQPILAQDADGRYLLALSSDRNLTRNQAIYFTWTFDFQHFAAPIQVLSDSGRALKLLRGDDGQLRCYAYIEPIRRVGRSTGPTPTLAMIESSNLVHWSPYVEFFSPYPDAPSKSRLFRSLFIVKGGGRYRLFADEAGSYPLTSDSGDGTNFSAPQKLSLPLQEWYASRRPPRVSGFYDDGHHLWMSLSETSRPCRTVLLRSGLGVSTQEWQVVGEFEPTQLGASFDSQTLGVVDGQAFTFAVDGRQRAVDVPEVYLLREPFEDARAPADLAVPPEVSIQMTRRIPPTPAN